MVKSTRLRFIRASGPDELALAIDGLTFKVELKAIQPDKNGWIAFFVIPDSVEWSSVDLR